MNSKVEKKESYEVITKEYADPLCFYGERFLLQLFEHTSCVPSIVAIENQTIQTRHRKGHDLFQLLQDYEMGTVTYEYVTSIFTQVLHQLQQMEKVAYDALHEYLNFECDFLTSMIVTDNGDVIVTQLANWQYGETYDNYSKLIASVKMYPFSDDKQKDKLVEDLILAYANQLGVEKSLFDQKVTKQVQLLKREERIRNISKDMTGVFMCGGKSSRMDYVPKQTLQLGNFTFLEHIVHALREFDEVIISTNEPLEGYTTTPDRIKEIGPIGGIYSVLKTTTKEAIFITACDMPNISKQFISFLLEQLNETDDCLIPVLEGREHPLCGVYKVRILPIVEQQIQAKQYRLRTLLQSINTHYVQVPQEFTEELFNVNTQELYKQQLKKITQNNTLTPITFLPLTL